MNTLKEAARHTWRGVRDTVLATVACAGCGVAVFIAIGLFLAVTGYEADEAETEPETCRTVGFTTYAAADVPNVRLTSRKLHVSDPAALLSTPARCTVDSILTALEDSTGVQVAVAMLPSIGDKDIFDFSQELFEKWGVGRKGYDDGLLMVYVDDIRKIRFHTGYGLEATMTDATSRRIQSSAMVSHFKEGDVDAGLVSGARAVSRLLSGGEPPTGRNEEDGDLWGYAVAFLAIVIGGAPAASLLGKAWRRASLKMRRCPSCGKRGGLRKAGDKAYYSGEGGLHWRQAYACALCGFEFETSGMAAANGGDKTVTAAATAEDSATEDHEDGDSYGGGDTGGGGATSGW